MGKRLYRTSVSSILVNFTEAEKYRLLFSFFLICFCLVFWSTTPAEAIEQPDSITLTDDDVIVFRDVSIAAFGDDVYVVWIDGDGVDSVPDDAIIRKGVFTAHKFSERTIVASDPLFSFVPSIGAFDNNVYVGYERYDPSFIFGESFLRTSNDGGRVFKEPVKAGESFSFFLDVRADAPDSAYFVFTNPLDEEGSNERLILVKATEGGQKVERLIDFSSDPRNTIQFSVDGDNFAIAWEESGNPSSIHFAYSFDGGKTISGPIELENPGENFMRPDIAIDGSNLYILWGSFGFQIDDEGDGFASEDPPGDFDGDGLDNDDLDCRLVEVQGRDSDNDGLSDEHELIIGTDPNDPDSNDDGVLDGDFLRRGIDIDIFFSEVFSCYEEDLTVKPGLEEIIDEDNIEFGEASLYLRTSNDKGMTFSESTVAPPDRRSGGNVLADDGSVYVLWGETDIRGENSIQKFMLSHNGGQTFEDKPFPGRLLEPHGDFLYFIRNDGVAVSTDRGNSPPTIFVEYDFEPIFQVGTRSHFEVYDTELEKGVYVVWNNREEINFQTIKVVTSTLVVNTVNDDDDGTCDKTHCSLREAINTINNDPNYKRILFDIEGTGPHRISPTSPLPEITNPIIIDGSSEPDFVGFDNPVVSLHGEFAGNSANGLVLKGGNSIVRGLSIDIFNKNGILIQSDKNTIVGNLIGKKSQGILGLGNSENGIKIEGSENTIGGTSPDDANKIENNQGSGIQVMGGGNNKIIGNKIGHLSETPIASNQKDGIEIIDSSFNMIGDKDGITPGGECSGGCNLIVRNGESGVNVKGESSIGNSIRYNSIFDNNFLGINLSEKPAGEETPNDLGDVDSGPNDLMNYPEDLFSVVETSGISVSGKLDTNLELEKPEIDIYSNSEKDREGFGEGETYLFTIPFDEIESSGSFVKTVPEIVGQRHFSATATNAEGSTSEFSFVFDSLCKFKITVQKGKPGDSQVGNPDVLIDGVRGDTIVVPILVEPLEDNEESCFEREITLELFGTFVGGIFHDTTDTTIVPLPKSHTLVVDYSFEDTNDFTTSGILNPSFTKNIILKLKDDFPDGSGVVGIFISGQGIHEDEKSSKEIGLRLVGFDVLLNNEEPNEDLEVYTRINTEGKTETSLLSNFPQIFPGQLFDFPDNEVPVTVERFCCEFTNDQEPELVQVTLNRPADLPSGLVVELSEKFDSENVQCTSNSCDIVLENTSGENNLFDFFSLLISVDKDNTPPFGTYVFEVNAVSEAKNFMQTPNLIINFVPNTASGTDAFVEDLDFNKGGIEAIIIKFSQVNVAGDTFIETVKEGPQPPTGFALVQLGGETTFFEINTNAEFSGPVTIGMTYDDTGISPEQEQQIRLMHFSEQTSMWEDVTVSVDTSNNIITGEVESFSTFAITTPLDFQQLPEEPIDDVPIGGEIVPIDTTALLLAKAHTTISWLIPIAVSAIGFGIVILRKF